MPITYPDADYIRGTGEIPIGQRGIFALETLGLTDAGPGSGPNAPQYTSQITTSTGDNQLTVGEEFTITRTPKGDVGFAETVTYTMRGTGIYFEDLNFDEGAQHDVIIADRVNADGETASIIIFPYGDAPAALLVDPESG